MNKEILDHIEKKIKEKAIVREAVNHFYKIIFWAIMYLCVFGIGVCAYGIFGL